ncbi:MAG: epoxyqueuosine reductase QueH [Synergistaceae bacterium]|nr:epoxyqueuosine reductase QueH [Synergistaceae bacterium]
MKIMYPENELMLHICCAPDAVIPWAELSKSMRVTGFFYGSNIHPSDEYSKRRGALEKLMSNVNGQCIYPEYLPDSWLLSAGVLSEEPEGGRRCALCFRLQLEHTMRAAVDCGCSYICTTLTISPHKDIVLINSIGNEIAKNFGITWVERVWRKNNGFLDSVKMAKSLGLYRQNYCGCIYSKERESI